MTPLSLNNMQIALVEPKQKRGVVNELDVILGSDIETESFEFTPDAESLELATILTTIDQLEAFNGSIKRYGLTRSLLAFADHDRVLSQAIPAIPALETLTSDRSVKNSADVVAAVEASIGDAIQVFVMKLKARIKNMIGRMTGKAKKLNVIILHVKTLQEMMAKGREFDETALKTRKFKLVPHDYLFAGYKSIPAKESLVKMLTETELPDSEAEFKPWLEKVRREFNALKYITETEMDQFGKLKYDYSKTPNTEDTVHGHGYTNLGEFNEIAGHIESLYKSVDGYISMLNSLGEKYRVTKTTATLMWSHRASDVAFDVVYFLFLNDIWLGAYASFNVIKAMFACTEKKK